MKWDKFIIRQCPSSAANQAAKCSLRTDSTGGDGGVDPNDPGTDPNDPGGGGTQDCSNATWAAAHPEVCGAQDCSNPAWAALHPEQCSGGGDDPGGGEITQHLILKPETVSKPTGDYVQFRTYLVGETGEEQEITSGLTYRSSDMGIVLIGAIGGKASAVSEGIATVTVTWQDMNASAQMQVTGSCDDLIVGLVVVLDISKSMGQPFSVAPYAPGESVYATRYAFAKVAALQFVNEVNTLKDKVGFVSFDTQNALTSLTDDKNAVVTAINNATRGNNRTNCSLALKRAIDHLNASSVDKKVIVLISDGENKEGDNPETLASQFKETGGTIVCVGVRSGERAYRLLHNLASDGMLINALPTNAKASLEYLSGLKSYFCAGNCVPEGDNCWGFGANNYTRWAKWTNVEGYNDLIGDGGGTPLFDLLPGNGLYVDLVGSSPPWAGKLISQETFTLEAAVDYKLKFRLAGNQRAETPGHKVKAWVGSLGEVIIEMDDWRQDFTEYELDVVGDGNDHNIGFQQVGHSGVYAEISFGILLDDVRLIAVDSGEVLFRDTFDNENQRCLPPRCGAGTYGYGYGGCYGTGCLTSPVPQQMEDVNPPIDVEEAAPVIRYTATRSYTATCPAGTSGSSVTKTVTATSTVSRADAEAKALKAAQDAAEVALSCDIQLAVGDMVNLHALPAGEATTKRGAMVLGDSAQDFWNTLPGLESQIALRNQRMELCGVTVKHYQIAHVFPNTTMAGENNPDNPDPMLRRGILYNVSQPDLPERPDIKFYGLPDGDYEIVVYGHGPELNDNGVYSANNTIEDSGAMNTTRLDMTYKTDNLKLGVQYGRCQLNYVFARDSYLNILTLPNSEGEFRLYGIQIKRIA